jgi:hypothetical protein
MLFFIMISCFEMEIFFSVLPKYRSSGADVFTWFCFFYQNDALIGLCFFAICICFINVLLLWSLAVCYFCFFYQNIAPLELMFLRGFVFFTKMTPL